MSDVDGVIDAADMDAMAATDLLAGGHDGEGQALNLRKDAAPSAAGAARETRILTHNEGEPSKYLQKTKI